MTAPAPAPKRRISNAMIIIAVGLAVFVVSYLMNAGPTSSGFKASQQIGYIAGQAVLAALITWAILKYVLRRS